VGADLPVLFTALLAVGVLLATMRWVFGTSRPGAGLSNRGPNADLGLLRPVLSSVPRREAQQAKNLLSSKGIRCSLSWVDRDRYDLLVFAEDLESARQLLNTLDG